MARRTFVALAACIALFLSGTAGAQTTTTSTTSTSTSTTTSSSTSTTSTTIVNPCAGRPCTAQPPAAFLAGSGGEVQLDLGGFCWRQPDGMTTLCTAFTAPPGGFVPSQTLVVRAGETLTLRFAIAMPPTSVSLNRLGEERVLAAANPTTLRVDMGPGIFTGTFLTRWLQGDASYGVRLDVRDAPSSTTVAPRPVALTG